MPQNDLSPAMLYGAGAIAGYLGMSEHAARHLISQRVIPTFKIGTRIAARRATLDAWLADQEALARQSEEQAHLTLIDGGRHPSSRRRP
jgi:hypothetical protein